MTRWLWLRWVGPPWCAAVGVVELFCHPMLGVAALAYAGLLAAWVVWMSR